MIAVYAWKINGRIGRRVQTVLTSPIHHSFQSIPLKRMKSIGSKCSSPRFRGEKQKKRQRIATGESLSACFFLLSMFVEENQKKSYQIFSRTQKNKRVSVSDEFDLEFF